MTRVPQFGKLESWAGASRRVEEVAAAIRNLCSQRDAIPFDPFSCADEFGVRVRRVAFGASEISGNVITISGIPVVSIAANDGRQRQRFTMAHEIAHLCFGRSDVAFPVERTRGPSSAGRLERREEALCNRIAAELLMPRREVARFLSPSSPSFGVLQGFASHFDVSVMAGLVRIRELRYWSVAEARWRYESRPEKRLRRVEQLSRRPRCVVGRQIRSSGDRSRIERALWRTLRSARELLLEDFGDAGHYLAKLTHGEYVVLPPASARSPEVFVKHNRSGVLVAFAVY